MNFFSLFKRKIIYTLRRKINIDKDSVEFNSIDDLFYNYGSDKSNIFKINDEKGHGFSKYYDLQLKDYKNKELKILEVGSYAGASAASFKKYFPNSKIFCFDINISNFKYFSKNIHVYGIDIAKEQKLKKTLNIIFQKYKFESFDIIIDDGSHNLSDILLGFKNLFNCLSRKGIYIIEDYKFPNYFQRNKDIDHIFIDELINKINSKNFFDSSLISKNFQKKVFSEINEIITYRGNLEHSDICFLKKN